MSSFLGGDPCCSYLRYGSKQLVNGGVTVGAGLQVAARELAVGAGELGQEDLVVVVGVEHGSHAARKLVQPGQAHPLAALTPSVLSLLLVEQLPGVRGDIKPMMNRRHEALHRTEPAKDPIWT